jgi:hypothetical protein
MAKMTDQYLANNVKYAARRCTSRAIPASSRSTPPSTWQCCRSICLSQWDLRRGMSAILNVPGSRPAPDAVTVCGFVYDVDIGNLDDVSYPGPTGSIASNGFIGRPAKAGSRFFLE